MARPTDQQELVVVIRDGVLRVTKVGPEPLDQSGRGGVFVRRGLPGRCPGGGRRVSGLGVGLEQAAQVRPSAWRAAVRTLSSSSLPKRVPRWLADSKEPLT